MNDLKYKIGKLYVSHTVHFPVFRTIERAINAGGERLPLSRDFTNYALKIEQEHRGWDGALKCNSIFMVLNIHIESRIVYPTYVLEDCYLQVICDNQVGWVLSQYDRIEPVK